MRVYAGERDNIPSSDWHLMAWRQVLKSLTAQHLLAQRLGVEEGLQRRWWVWHKLA